MASTDSNHASKLRPAPALGQGAQRHRHRRQTPVPRQRNVSARLQKRGRTRQRVDRSDYEEDYAKHATTLRHTYPSKWRTDSFDLQENTRFS